MAQSQIIRGRPGPPSMPCLALKAVTEGLHRSTFLCPKLWRDVQLEHRLNQTTEVVTALNQMVGVGVPPHASIAQAAT
jgi:uncharacterized protein YjeT (DUF2065 family)